MSTAAVSLSLYALLCSDLSGDVHVSEEAGVAVVSTPFGGPTCVRGPAGSLTEIVFNNDDTVQVVDEHGKVRSVFVWCLVDFVVSPVTVCSRVNVRNTQHQAVVDTQK